MPKHQWSQAAHRNATPDVPRPALAAWQTLESERIQWEGQVLIVGQEADLPALLVITGKRLALIANNVPARVDATRAEAGRRKWHSPVYQSRWE